MAPDAQQAIHAVYKMEAARLIAGVTRLVRDVGLAEELAHDALVAALEEWPRAGVPDNPGAWLMTTAKNLALNTLQRRKLQAHKYQALGHDIAAGGPHENAVAALEQRLDDDVGDDLLRLIFTACHPVLPTEARVALTLRLLGGLETDEIARAFLAPEPTIAQRIVRAKRTLAEKDVGFEVPRGPALPARLGSVLEVIYLIFNEGYAATAGDDLMRPALCEDALRLGRILGELMPAEPEVHGLVALMELNSSRTTTRTDAAGDPVLLADQDRGRWNALLIHRGLAALDRGLALAGTAGPYLLQAAIAACHARAPEASATDWQRIADLYAALATVAPSPIVELNRAVAVSMADGPAAALAITDALATEPALRTYHLLPAARAEFLSKLGRWTEAANEFKRAASLTSNTRQRDRLLKRADGCRRS